MCLLQNQIYKPAHQPNMSLLLLLPLLLLLLLLLLSLLLPDQ
jgi:hypothetical protein